MLSLSLSLWPMRGRLTFSLTAAASASQSLRRVGILLDHHSENLALVTKFRGCFQMMHFDAKISSSSVIFVVS